MISKFTFYASTAMILYVWLGYPLLLWLIQLGVRRPLQRRAFEPPVTLLIAAYNEADVIVAKIRNALALSYPAEQLEIVIVSDGSRDGTNELVQQLSRTEGQGRVRLLALPENRGKLAALNAGVSQARGHIVVFSDASTMLAPDSVRRLMTTFADPRVGATSGTYRVIKQDDAALGRQESSYWKYETFIRVQESKLGCALGAHGSLFAVRKDLYPSLPPGTINDDFIIPLRVLQQGFRVAYDPEAIAYEDAREMEGFARRIRIAAGNVEQLREIPRLLWPPRPLALFCFLSHKGGRLLCPFAMLALVVSNAFLRSSPLYVDFGLAQAAFYGLAFFGSVARLRPNFLRLPYYFCMVNLAFFAWLYHALRLQQLVFSRCDIDRLGRGESVTQIQR